MKYFSWAWMVLGLLMLGSVASVSEHPLHPNTAETASEQFELVVEYGNLIAHHKADIGVYLSDYATNTPVSDLAISVTVGESDPVPLSATETAGMYHGHIPMPGPGTFDWVFDIAGQDLLVASELVVQSPPSLPMISTQWMKWVYGLSILVGLLLIFWVMRKIFRALRRKGSSVCFLLAMVGVCLSAHAHEGHDHGFETQETLPIGGDIVHISKASQFLLGVRTVVITPKTFRKQVRALGKMVPRPQSSSDVYAMQEGLIITPPKKGFPLPGQKVKKGEAILWIQSVGSIPIYAPVSGTITELLFTQGQHVEHNSKLFSIVDFSMLWAEAAIYEADIPFVEHSRKAVIVSKSLPEKTFLGKLVNLGQIVDATTRTVKGVFEVANPEEILRVGMFVDVGIETRNTYSGILLPAQAVIDEHQQVYVFVHTKPQEFVRKLVSVGERRPEGIVIVKGLEEGERVVVEGNHQLASASAARPSQKGHTP